MGSADELLAAGDVDGARRALIEALRNDPREERARMFLFQLFCVTGEWERASAQLRALAELSPEARMLETLYNQTISAERTRAAAFTGKGPVPILIESPPWTHELAASIEAFARGDAQSGNALREKAFEEAPDVEGSLNDDRFGFIADMDARLGPTFEAIIAGRWGLVPFSGVAEIKSDGPKDLRDLVWLPVELLLRSGPGLAGFIPARYPGTESVENGDLRLARRTEWRDGISGQEGIGQRQWFTDDESEFETLALRRAVFV